MTSTARRDVTWFIQAFNVTTSDQKIKVDGAALPGSHLPGHVGWQAWFGKIPAGVLRCAAAFFLIVCFWPPTAAADPPTDDGIGPPTRSAVVPDGHYLRITNIHGGLAVDMNVVRQLSDGSTSGTTSNGEMNIYCQDGLKDCDKYGRSLDFGLPLYASVDGEISSCWSGHRNAPDPNKPDPLRCCGGLVDDDGQCLIKRNNGRNMSCDRPGCPTALANCTDKRCEGASPTCAITRSGNHLVIHTRDDHKVLYAHLAPGTIPPRLCPFDSPVMNDANNMACNGCGGPAEAVIPKANRPRVRRGDFLGRIGRSGGATGPHLHIGVRPVTENPDGTLANAGTLDYRLKNAWTRPIDDNTAWQKLAGDIAPAGPNLIHPTPFLRRASAEVAAVKNDISVTDSSVTLSLLPDGRAELISWNVASDGSLDIQDKASTSGQRTEVAIARPGNARNVVTAMRAANGELRMDFWRVAKNGTITRGDDDTSAGEVEAIDLAGMPEGRGVVSAVKTKSGNLKLIAWKISDQDLIQRRGSANGDAIRLVALTPIRFGRERAEPAIGSFSGFVTAAKLDDGRLQVATWSFDPSSGSIGPVDSRQFGEVAGQLAISAIKTHSDREMVVVAGRHNGRTRLISFTVSSDGTLTKKSERRLGDAVHIDISPVKPGRFALTGRIAARGTLRVLGVALEPEGKLILLGDELAGASGALADPIGAATSSLLRRKNGDTHLVFVALRNNSGVLQAITYDANLD